MQMSQVLIIGDSVFKGVVFDTARERYSLLRESADKLVASVLRLPIVNRSQMGRTAPDGLEILKSQVEDQLENQVVLLEFGGNDCDFDWAAVSENPDLPHQPKTTADAFVAALGQMIHFVRQAGGKPLLATLPPLDCHRYLNWITRNGLSRENILKFIGVPERIYRWQEYYSTLVLRVAQTTGCECMPVREAFLERVKSEDVLCVDGIHPNALGHQIIAETAARFARERGYA